MTWQTTKGARWKNAAQSCVSPALQSLALLFAAQLAISPARAELDPQPTASISERQAISRADYERILEEMTISADRAASIAASIATLKKDHQSITTALIQAAKTEKKLAEDVETINGKLDELREQQSGIKQSLNGRRAILAEVLAALQRMGLNPPPAILVRPEDALASVRSAILLGAVVPELRSETELLMTDLRELSRITASIEGEHDKLLRTAANQVAEKQRLNMLLEEKQRLQARSETDLAGEQQRSEELASSAKSLKDLIDDLQRQSDIAQKAEEQRLAQEEAEANKPVPEAHRLVASIPFGSLKGKIDFPVTGKLTGRFGQSDNLGAHYLGDTLTTQSGSIVTAPAGGTVLYAGPFRSYGQLLILNAGDGYHIVLAGMDRISASLGQTLLAGEPVGAMREKRVAGPVSVENDQAGTTLYVEFRKDGKPVNPSPWWSERVAGRTAHDS